MGEKNLKERLIESGLTFNYQSKHCFFGFCLVFWDFLGLLDCWFVGLLVCWFVGLLVCCFVGLLLLLLLLLSLAVVIVVERGRQDMWMFNKA